jgi:hypothetical protein
LKKRRPSQWSETGRGAEDGVGGMTRKIVRKVSRLPTAVWAFGYRLMRVRCFRPIPVAAVYDRRLHVARQTVGGFGPPSVGRGRRTPPPIRCPISSVIIRRPRPPRQEENLCA